MSHTRDDQSPQGVAALRAQLNLAHVARGARPKNHPPAAAVVAAPVAVVAPAAAPTATPVGDVSAALRTRAAGPAARRRPTRAARGGTAVLPVAALEDEADVVPAPAAATPVDDSEKEFNELARLAGEVGNNEMFVLGALRATQRRKRKLTPPQDGADVLAKAAGAVADDAANDEAVRRAEARKSIAARRSWWALQENAIPVRYLEFNEDVRKVVLFFERAFAWFAADVTRLHQEGIGRVAAAASKLAIFEMAYGVNVPTIAIPAVCAATEEHDEFPIDGVMVAQALKRSVVKYLSHLIPELDELRKPKADDNNSAIRNIIKRLVDKGDPESLQFAFLLHQIMRFAVMIIAKAEFTKMPAGNMGLMLSSSAIIPMGTELSPAEEAMFTQMVAAYIKADLETNHDFYAAPFEVCFDITDHYQKLRQQLKERKQADSYVAMSIVCPFDLELTRVQLINGMVRSAHLFADSIKNLRFASKAVGQEACKVIDKWVEMYRDQPNDLASLVTFLRRLAPRFPGLPADAGVCAVSDADVCAVAAGPASRFGFISDFVGDVASSVKRRVGGFFDSKPNIEELISSRQVLESLVANLQAKSTMPTSEEFFAMVKASGYFDVPHKLVDEVNFVYCVVLGGKMTLENVYARDAEASMVPACAGARS